VRTVGVDLAAEAKGTAVAVIEWPAESTPGGPARLAGLRVGEDDRAVLADRRITQRWIRAQLVGV
jgi:hypothetical protein